MKYTFSELTEKEVINCGMGTSIGFVSDLTVSCSDGRILSLVVTPETCGISLKKPQPICIPWEKVDRIGRDFIIVNGVFGHPEEIKGEKRQIKTFFGKPE